jgi:hypothetical protein
MHKSPPNTPDPTKQPIFTSLLKEIQENQNVCEYLKSLGDSKCALVFSGGGGKGAYEAGVMLALFDCGVRKFRAFAGTSVGGLNAVLCNALCRTGDRELVLKTWCEISYNKVLRVYFGRLAVVLVAKLLFAIAMSPIALPIAILEALRGLGLDTQYDKPPPSASLLMKMSLALCSLFGFFYFTGGYVTPENLKWYFVIAIPAALIASVVLTLAIPRLHLLSNEPLRTMIHAFDLDAIRRSDDPYYTPTYITLARTSRTHLLFTSFSLGFWPIILPERWGKIAWPNYLDVSVAKAAGTIEYCLLQTAAIPEGFPGGALTDGYVVDGGVADNTPILPVCDHNPQKLLVVYL